MDFTKLRDYLDKTVREYKVPGVDCIVYKEHKEIFRYFTGMSDIENNKQMQGDELCFLFSMTKMFTCVCALQLLERGKYLLSDPVSKYLPEFEKMKLSKDELNTENAAKIASGKMQGEDINSTAVAYAKNPITVRDLFTMSAGLDYNLQAEGIKKALSEGKTSTRELVRAISETVLGFEPGTRFRYSLCHDVLGALIEVWSGKSFGEYLKENVSEPLGMKNTFFGMPDSDEKLSKMMARYTYDENGNPKRLDLENAFNLSREYESGGAGLVSCAEDYALLLDALANGGMGKSGKRILSSATVELMSTNHLDGQAFEDFQAVRKGYGYGLGVRTHVDRTISGSLSPIGEFGWDGAAGGFSMVDTKNKLSLTYIQHIHNWDIRLQEELRNVLYSCID